MNNPTHTLRPEAVVKILAGTGEISWSSTAPTPVTMTDEKRGGDPVVDAIIDGDPVSLRVKWTDLRNVERADGPAQKINRQFDLDTEDIWSDGRHTPTTRRAALDALQAKRRTDIKALKASGVVQLADRLAERQAAEAAIAREPKPTTSDFGPDIAIQEVAPGVETYEGSGVWSIPSDSRPGRRYEVPLSVEGHALDCGCEDRINRRRRCKHMIRAELMPRWWRAVDVLTDVIDPDAIAGSWLYRLREEGFDKALGRMEAKAFAVQTERRVHKRAV